MKPDFPGGATRLAASGRLPLAKDDTYGEMRSFLRTRRRRAGAVTVTEGVAQSLRVSAGSRTSTFEVLCGASCDD